MSFEGLPPTFLLLLLLAVNTGICFFGLSTISLVLQRWLSASNLKESENPYILYSPSNLGSILGLLSYPFVVERLLRHDSQSSAWWIGYLLLILILIPCTPKKVKEEAGEDVKSEDLKDSANTSSPLRWLGLSTCGSALLLATTNIISFDIASTALLWVLPLTLYLLTFVLVFKSKTWFPSCLMTVAFWILPLGLVIGWFAELHIVLPSMILMGVLYLATLFVLCMCCHGTLHRERPRDPGQLTRFYLYMSLGGFTGSVFINWLIPLISDRSIEYPLTLFLTVLLLSYSKGHQATQRTWSYTAVYLVVLLGVFFVIGKFKVDPQLAFLGIGLLIMLPLIATKRSPSQFRNFYACGIIALLASPYLISSSTNHFFHRNFYGIYKIFDQNGKRHLHHGTTLHGTQYLDDSDKHFLPLAYYHPNTPSGALLNGNPLGLTRIGMIGLGSGEYLNEGQSMTVYEQDRDNVEIADSHFTFLQRGRDQGAEIDFVVGDGRLALKSVEDESFDLFIVDAFSSDSIPVHLVTVEAMQE
ncbi:MAG: hypothetical protein P8L44_22050 [Opitutales bacterium]|nr:hypothetical protein [Opitutales bacterium]